MPQLNAPLDEDPGLDQFSDEVRQDVEGLMWLGHLEDDFEFCGHRFTIRTLKADEELNAALISKEYIESMGQAKAWQWAQVALSLTAVDGNEEFCPPAGPDKQAFARARFKWVTEKWYGPTLAYIFNRFMQLTARQLAAIDAVRDLSDRGLQSSSPNVDSLTEQGASKEEKNPAEETLQHLD